MPVQNEEWKGEAATRRSHNPSPLALVCIIHAIINFSSLPSAVFFLKERRPASQVYLRNKIRKDIIKEEVKILTRGSSDALDVGRDKPRTTPRTANAEGAVLFGQESGVRETRTSRAASNPPNLLNRSLAPKLLRQRSGEE